ncbi:MAG: hypothetical protein COA88_13415 [Kordia sp.]|nr:MAG: hypothetical protein COA88_13415 [Kordia sp.]
MLKQAFQGARPYQVEESAGQKGSRQSFQHIFAGFAVLMVHEGKPFKDQPVFGAVGVGDMVLFRQKRNLLQIFQLVA